MMGVSRQLTGSENYFLKTLLKSLNSFEGGLNYLAIFQLLYTRRNKQTICVQFSFPFYSRAPFRQINLGIFQKPQRGQCSSSECFVNFVSEKESG